MSEEFIPQLLTSEDVFTVQFPATKFRDGYDQNQIDDYLDEIVRVLSYYEALNASPEAEVDLSYITVRGVDVREVDFDYTRMRVGYDQDAVDDYLDQVAATLDAYENAYGIPPSDQRYQVLQVDGAALEAAATQEAMEAGELPADAGADMSALGAVSLGASPAGAAVPLSEAPPQGDSGAEQMPLMNPDMSGQYPEPEAEDYSSILGTPPGNRPGMPTASNGIPLNPFNMFPGGAVEGGAEGAMPQVPGQPEAAEQFAPADTGGQYAPAGQSEQFAPVQPLDGEYGTGTVNPQWGMPEEQPTYQNYGYNQPAAPGYESAYAPGADYAGSDAEYPSSAGFGADTSPAWGADMAAQTTDFTTETAANAGLAADNPAATSPVFPGTQTLGGFEDSDSELPSEIDLTEEDAAADFTDFQAEPARDELATHEPVESVELTAASEAMQAENLEAASETGQPADTGGYSDYPDTAYNPYANQPEAWGQMGQAPDTGGVAPEGYENPAAAMNPQYQAYYDPNLAYGYAQPAAEMDNPSANSGEYPGASGFSESDVPGAEDAYAANAGAYPGWSEMPTPPAQPAPGQNVAPTGWENQPAENWGYQGESVAGASGFPEASNLTPTGVEGIPEPAAQTGQLPAMQFGAEGVGDGYMDALPQNEAGYPGSEVYPETGFMPGYNMSPDATAASAYAPYPGEPSTAYAEGYAEGYPENYAEGYSEGYVEGYPPQQPGYQPYADAGNPLDYAQNQGENVEAVEAAGSGVGTPPLAANMSDTEAPADFQTAGYPGWPKPPLTDVVTPELPTPGVGLDLSALQGMNSLAATPGGVPDGFGQAPAGSPDTSFVTADDASARSAANWGMAPHDATEAEPGSAVATDWPGTFGGTTASADISASAAADVWPGTPDHNANQTWSQPASGEMPNGGTVVGSIGLESTPNPVYDTPTSAMETTSTGGIVGSEPLSPGLTFTEVPIDHEAATLAAQAAAETEARQNQDTDAAETPDQPTVPADSETAANFESDNAETASETKPLTSELPENANPRPLLQGEEPFGEVTEEGRFVPHFLAGYRSNLDTFTSAYGSLEERLQPRTKKAESIAKLEAEQPRKSITTAYLVTVTTSRPLGSDDAVFVRLPDGREIPVTSASSDFNGVHLNIPRI